MKNIMPCVGTTPAQNELVRYQPTLARFNDDDSVFTVIRVHDKGVLFIYSDRICHNTYQYFQENYTVVRPYKSGETLSITM